MSGTVTDEPVVRSAVPVVDLAPLEAALQSSDDAALKDALKRFRPADVGREFARLKVGDARRLLEGVNERMASFMLRSAHPMIAGRVLAGCKPDHAARTLAFLPTDVQVAILGTLLAPERDPIEKLLPGADARDVAKLLSYSETSVARLMTPKIWTCDATATAGEAMRILRERGPDIEVAANLYVVRDARLVGVAPLREVAVAPPETRVADFMVKDVISVREDAERGDAAEIITTHNFLSLPVVDHAGTLVGAVTVDDLLEAAVKRVGAGLLNQGGVVGQVAAQLPYFQTPLARVVRSRITWLILLFVAETATGTVLRHFEDALAKWVQLAFFIPLLIGTGGNAGSQTVSTVIRALALGEVRLRDVLRVVAKEVLAGLVLGILLGAIAFVRARMWGCDDHIAFCVGITIVVVCTWANTVGAAIPIAAQRIGIDPTVVSGPLITTLVDASGLFLYLTIAQLILSK